MSMLLEIVNNIKYKKVRNVKDLLNSNLPVYKNLHIYPKGYNGNTISYDVKDSWFNGLKYLGYPKLAIKLKNMPKDKRVPFIKSFKDKDDKGLTLYDQMELFWADSVKQFIRRNRIKFHQIVSIYYDEIELTPDTRINSTLIPMNKDGKKVLIKFVK